MTNTPASALVQQSCPGPRSRFIAADKTHPLRGPVLCRGSGQTPGAVFLCWQGAGFCHDQPERDQVSGMPQMISEAVMLGKAAQFVQSLAGSSRTNVQKLPLQLGLEQPRAIGVCVQGTGR